MRRALPLVAVLVLTACTQGPSLVLPTDSPSPTPSADQQLDARLHQITEQLPSSSELQELTVDVRNGIVTVETTELTSDGVIDKRVWNDSAKAHRNQEPARYLLPRAGRPIDPQTVQAAELLSQIRRFAAEQGCPGASRERNASLRLGSLPDGRPITELRCRTGSRFLLDGRVLELPTAHDSPEAALTKTKAVLRQVLPDDQVTHVQVRFGQGMVTTVDAAQARGRTSTGAPCWNAFSVGTSLSARCTSGRPDGASVSLDQIDPRVMLGLPDQLGRPRPHAWEMSLRIKPDQRYWTVTASSTRRDFTLDGRPLG